MTFEQMNESTPPAGSESQETSEGGEVEIELGAPKKKNTSLFVLIGLGVAAAVVVYFMYLRPGPQTASAAAPAGGGASDIQQFLNGGNINQMKQTLKDTEKLVQQFRAFPGNTQVPLGSLKTNPFRELEPVADAAAPKVNEDEEAKEHAKALNAVADLHLQSIMRGSKHSSCLINNTLYREGAQVGIFKVSRIDPGAVVLESGKYRFELKIQN